MLVVSTIFLWVLNSLENMNSVLEDRVSCIFSSAEFSAAWLWDGVMNCHLCDRLIETDFYRHETPTSVQWEGAVHGFLSNFWQGSELVILNMYLFVFIV